MLDSLHILLGGSSSPSSRLESERPRHLLVLANSNEVACGSCRHVEQYSLLYRCALLLLAAQFLQQPSDIMLAISL